MFDLLYFDDDLEGYRKTEKALQKRFPEVVLGDDTDYIHGWRLTVSLSDEKEEKYFNWLKKQKLSPASLLLGLKKALG